MGGVKMKSYKIPVLLLLATVGMGAGMARGGSEEKAPAGGTWEAAARQCGLSDADISALATNRILVADQAYKQIFSAYLSGERPLFITSDSLLNAYHVLYEESIFRLENARAARLPEILKLILKNIEDTDAHLSGNPTLAAAAKRRAMLVTGVALKLLDDSFQFKDKAMNATLDQEVKRIGKAEGVEKPEWLGKPDASFTALDYSRYKPRGFYTRSERLQRYFRAVAWLQSIPFRVSQNEELLAILMLGNSLAKSAFQDFSKRQEVLAFFRAYSSFVGAGDDWDLIMAANEARTELRMDLAGNDLPKKRTELIKAAEQHGEGPKINDQIRFAPDNPQMVAEPNFRIISAYRTPCAILFQRSTDIRRFKRSYPSGLEVAAGLGSAFAKEHLADPQKEDLLKTIAACQPCFQGDGLFIQYLEALKALLDKPEKDAPDFMKTEAWTIKSCNTALAGWAQLRHTWVLQAKQTVNYLGMTRPPKGFVEPEPAFFSRMAALADATRKLLKEAGAFEENHEETIRVLENFIRILERVEDDDGLYKKVSKLPRDEQMSFELPFMLMLVHPTVAKEGAKAFKEQKEWFSILIADMKKGESDRHPELKKVLREYEFDLDESWGQLEKVSRRLEAIAHKQLRHAELNDDENDFIGGYGRTIAGIMLYGGNSYLTPRDDAPRVVDVYANPQAGGFLEVGIARPRKLYVLYPWQGKPVLCVGAVLPYYEFVATARLTDESWKETLDSEKRPVLLKWLAPIVSGGALSKPRFEKDE
jgi:hypothetical protein